MKTTLIDFKFVRSESDHAIFVGERNGKQIYIALYVDDLLITGEDDDDIGELKAELMERYEMKDPGIAKRFLGMDIEHGADGQIKVHVAGYLEDVLERHGLLDCNPVSIPMLNTEKLVPATDSDALADRADYQQIVREVMFAGLVARPDIIYAVSILAQFGNNPTSTHLKAAKHLLRYLKGTIRLGIIYSMPPQVPHAFSDSDWAGDVNSRRSRTGYLIKLNNDAIIWRTILQLTVALSTTEAEYMALAEALKEIMWLRQFLIDLDYGDPNLATTLFTDNQGALALAEICRRSYQSRSLKAHRYQASFHS
jgi:hypothetical protein